MGRITARKRAKKQAARKLGCLASELVWREGILWTKAGAVAHPVELPKTPGRRTP